MVSDDQNEPNRVLGFPVGRRPAPRPRRPDARAGPAQEPTTTRREAEESQRVLGFSVDRFRQVNLGWLRTLARSVAGKRR
jgi:hypothetical protein